MKNRRRLLTWGDHGPTSWHPKHTPAAAIQETAVTMVLLCGAMILGDAIRTLMVKTGCPRGTCADAIRLGVNARSIRTRRTTGGEWTVGPN